jgi:hypothetical protein
MYNIYIMKKSKINQSELDKVSINDLYAMKKVARFHRGYHLCNRDQIKYFTKIIMKTEKEILLRIEKCFGKIPD